MVRIHGCYVTSREAMLFMSMNTMANVKVHLIKDLQRKCKYYENDILDIMQK